MKGKVEAGKAWAKGKVEAGKKWARGKAAAVGGLLKSTCARLLGRTFDTPFAAADGKQHRLYTRPGAPEELYVASRPSRLVAAFAHLRSAKLKARIAELDGKFKYRMREYRRRVKALQSRGEAWAQRNPGAVQTEERSMNAIREDAKKIQLEIAQFAKDNMRSGQGAGAHAPGIGTIAPYGSRLSSLHNSVPEWMMIAEHIIPDGLLRATLMALVRAGRREKGDTRYTEQPTIMIYYAAAAGKTGGVPWKKTRGGDLDLIERMKNVVGFVRTAAGGEHQGLRKPASGEPPADLVPKRYWRIYMKDQFERRVKPLFDSQTEKALSRTKAAVKAEQAEVGDRRGAGAIVRPTDAELDAAHSAQKAHMDRVLKQYREEADFD